MERKKKGTEIKYKTNDKDSYCHLQLKMNLTLHKHHQTRFLDFALKLI